MSRDIAFPSDARDTAAESIWVQWFMALEAITQFQLLNADHDERNELLLGMESSLQVLFAL